jgi:hypothetical protein
MTNEIRSSVPIENVAGKRRFAFTITVFTVLGHMWLGFEASYAQPLVALATAYVMQLLLESVDARSSGRLPRFAGGFVPLLDFLTSAHIAALSIAMLLYFNDRLIIVSFAVATAIGSKYVLRFPVKGRMVHFMNPSNLAITTTLLLFPWVGLAMPWQFSANLTGNGDWILPLVIFCLGSFLNFVFTKRIPAIVAFLVAFVVQAVVRSLWFGTPPLAALLPATGVEALIFTFYMLPDPATSPSRTVPQILFGSSVAILYGIIVANHIVFGLFYALTIVCACRGLSILVGVIRESRNISVVAEPAVASAPIA